MTSTAMARHTVAAEIARWPTRTVPWFRAKLHMASVSTEKLPVVMPPPIDAGALPMNIKTHEQQPAGLADLAEVSEAGKTGRARRDRLEPCPQQPLPQRQLRQDPGMPEFADQQPRPTHRDQDDGRPHRQPRLQAPAGRSAAIPASAAAVEQLDVHWNAQPADDHQRAQRQQGNRVGRESLRILRQAPKQVEPGVAERGHGVKQRVERGAARRHDVPQAPVDPRGSARRRPRPPA